MDNPVEAAARARILTEARGWIGTPYHHAADVKGAGVDCAMLILRVLVAAGVLADFDPRPYPPDWHLHRSEERYLAHALRLGHEVLQPRPADVVLVKYGRTFSHGGLVVAWPRVIHAFQPARRVEEADFSGPPFAGRPMRFFSPFGA